MSPTQTLRANLRQMVAVLQEERQALAGLDLDAIMGAAVSKQGLCDLMEGAQPHEIDDECRGLLEAARRLSVKLVACTVADLDRVAGQVLTPSKLVLETKGVPSIAEASALVAAGRNARLLGTRVATAGATCAIAIGEGR